MSADAGPSDPGSGPSVTPRRRAGPSREGPGEGESGRRESGRRESGRRESGRREPGRRAARPGAPPEADPDLKDDEGTAGGPRLWIRLGTLALVALVAWSVVERLGATRTRTPESVQQVQLVRPPEPPPPPEREPEPPPPEAPEDPDRWQDATEPDDMPPAIDDMLGLDASGVAGADGFGLRAKAGGRDLVTIGEKGTGQGDPAARARYARDLERALVAALDRDDDLRRRDYEAAFLLWIGEGGLVERAELRAGTGDPGLDRRIRDRLQLVRSLPRPPTGLPSPVGIRIRAEGSGQRAGEVPPTAER